MITSTYIVESGGDVAGSETTKQVNGYLVANSASHRSCADSNSQDDANIANKAYAELSSASSSSHMWSPINSALCLKGNSNCQRSQEFGDLHHLGDVSYLVVDDRSHIKCHLGSRANTIQNVPLCLLDAGSALRGSLLSTKTKI